MNYQQPLTIYSGQGMLHAEVEKMRNSKGGLLSLNNFLSTSIDQAVSLDYARRARENPPLAAILFRMGIDPSIVTAPFVLWTISVTFQDKEKDILFSMQTVVDIDEIT